MNGVYLRSLTEPDFSSRLASYLEEQGYAWDPSRVEETVPLVQEKLVRLGDYPSFTGFLFQEAAEIAPAAAELDGAVLAAALDALTPLTVFDVDSVEAALRTLPDDLGIKPRNFFRPLYTAVCGRPTGPSLFHSLPLLGKEETLERLRRAVTLSSPSTRPELTDGPPTIGRLNTSDGLGL
jgi:glutamyl-tRNA synthetase